MPRVPDLARMEYFVVIQFGSPGGFRKASAVGKLYMTAGRLGPITSNYGLNPHI